MYIYLYNSLIINHKANHHEKNITPFPLALRIGSNHS